MGWVLAVLLISWPGNECWDEVMSCRPSWGLCASFQTGVSCQSERVTRWGRGFANRKQWFFFLCQTSYKKTLLIRKPKREVLMQITTLQKALFPQPSWQWEVTSTSVTPQELPCNFGNKVLCQFWALHFVESASFQPRLLGRALVSAVADDLFLSGVLQRALIFSVFKGEMCTWRYFKAISLKGYKNKINTWHRDSWSAWWIF